MEPFRGLGPVPGRSNSELTPLQNALKKAAEIDKKVGKVLKVFQNNVEGYKASSDPIRGTPASELTQKNAVNLTDDLADKLINKKGNGLKLLNRALSEMNSDNRVRLTDRKFLENIRDKLKKSSGPFRSPGKKALVKQALKQIEAILDKPLAFPTRKPPSPPQANRPPVPKRPLPATPSSSRRPLPTPPQQKSRPLRPPPNKTLKYTNLPPESRLKYTELPPETKIKYTELPPEEEVKYSKLSPDKKYIELPSEEDDDAADALIFHFLVMPSLEKPGEITPEIKKQAENFIGDTYNKDNLMQLKETLINAPNDPVRQSLLDAVDRRLNEL